MREERGRTALLSLLGLVPRGQGLRHPMIKPDQVTNGPCSPALQNADHFVISGRRGAGASGLHTGMISRVQNRVSYPE